MPWGLTRFHPSGQSHFVTFCCYHRRALFTTDASRRIFESALERVRRSYRLHLYGYLVMPEHVHLLLSEPQPDMLADALKSLKGGVSRRLLCDGDHFWQKRYYDFNIGNYPQFVEKRRYIHRDPLKAGFCASVRRTGSGAVSATMQPVVRDGRDRVGMDGAKTRTSCGKTLPSHRTAPLKPNRAGIGHPS